MNTLTKGKAVHFNDQYLTVELDDGRVISTPMHWYGELQEASFRQLKNNKFICQGTGIEWPEIDYQLSIESMLMAIPVRKAA
jgi:hypothetical protein